jgi:hypothetical protein
MQKKEPTEAESSTSALLLSSRFDGAWANNFPGGLGGLTKTGRMRPVRQTTPTISPPIAAHAGLQMGKTVIFTKIFVIYFEPARGAGLPAEPM